MMKFFRKYNKQLLALFMALLMIVFIGGSALEGMLTPAQNRVVATSSVGEINYVDQQQANNTTELLGMINMNWRNPVGGSHKPLEVIDWILLEREANKLGTPTDTAFVRTSVSQEDLENMSRALRVKPARVLDAMGQLRAIQRTAFSIGAAAARDSLETVKVKAVMLPAKAFVDETQEFSEAELQAQFDKYKEKEAGGGLDFGYYQHPALKVQFIAISREKIAEQVKIANLEREARTFYDENKTKDRKFRRPADQIAPNTEGPAPEPYLSWEESKTIAETAVREKHAEGVVDRLANWLIQYASEPWVDAERDPDGYKKAPSVATDKEFYHALVKRIPPALTFSDAVVVWYSNWFTHEDANKTAMIGTTFFIPQGGSPTPFKDIVFRNQFSVPKVSDEEGVNTADYVALFQTSPYAMKNRLSGETYVFRIVEGRAGHPAESLAEVREQVVNDLRLQRAFEVAKGHAASLLSCEPGQSLKDAFEADAELKGAKAGSGINHYEPSPFSRVPKHMAGKGRPEDGVMVSGGVGLLPNDVVDGCFALEEAIDKKAVFEMPARADVMVVEWVETKRPDDESYLALRKQLTTQLAQMRIQEAMSDWLDPEQIRARNGFVLVER